MVEARARDAICREGSIRQADWEATWRAMEEAMMQHGVTRHEEQSGIKATEEGP